MERPENDVNRKLLRSDHILPLQLQFNKNKFAKFDKIMVPLLSLILHLKDKYCVNENYIVEKVLIELCMLCTNV